MQILKFLSKNERKVSQNIGVIQEKLKRNVQVRIYLSDKAKILTQNHFHDQK